MDASNQRAAGWCEAAEAAMYGHHLGADQSIVDDVRLIRESPVVIPGHHGSMMAKSACRKAPVRIRVVTRS